MKLCEASLTALVTTSHLQVATASGLGVFWKLLLLWRGSIYKLVWTNLALYIVLYYSLSLTYRFLLDPGGRVRADNTTRTST